MSDEVLKPCPICGKKVSIARIDNEVGERWWFITRGTYRTTRCNCRLFLESEKFTCGWSDDYALECRAKLIEKWNTRATHGTLTAEHVREAVEEAKAELLESCEYVGDMCQRQGDVLKAFGKMEQAIADELNAELGSDDEYEAKMDALLCRLTNGKWSKTRAYDLDFMVSCVDEEYEELYEKERDELGSGTCEWVFAKKYMAYDAYQCSICGQVEHKQCESDELPNYCKNCGGKAVKR